MNSLEPLQTYWWSNFLFNQRKNVYNCDATSKWWYFALIEVHNSAIFTLNARSWVNRSDIPPAKPLQAINRSRVNHMQIEHEQEKTFHHNHLLLWCDAKCLDIAESGQKKYAKCWHWKANERKFCVSRTFKAAWGLISLHMRVNIRENNKITSNY